MSQSIRNEYTPSGNPGENYFEPANPGTETTFFVYSMFHLTWTTFKFNRNQLGTISAFVMISVPGSNQRAHQVISEELLFKEFHGKPEDHK